MSGTINGNFDGRYSNGNDLQRERDKASSKTIAIQDPKTRFCEGCQRLVPRPKFKLYKGWRCEECKSNKKLDIKLKTIKLTL